MGLETRLSENEPHPVGILKGSHSESIPISVALSSRRDVPLLDSMVGGAHLRVKLKSFKHVNYPKNST